MERHDANAKRRTDASRKDGESKLVARGFTDLFRLCQATGASKDPAIAKALSFLAMSPDDRQLLEFVAEELDRRMCLDLVDPDPFRATNPVSEELPGEIKLGFVPPNRIKWGVKLDDLCCHLMLLGKSGAGKTATIGMLLMEALELRSGSHADNIRSKGGF
jgi:hypothetical protein